MEFNGEEVRDRLNALGNGGAIPPHAAWMPYVLATSGAPLLAEILERADLPDGGTQLIYTGLQSKRIVRVIASGTGHWEHPHVGKPTSVTTQSTSIDGATFTLDNTHTSPPEFGTGFTIDADVVISVGGETIRVPHVPNGRGVQQRAALDEFTAALIAELSG